MKKARVVVLFDTDAEPPASQEYKKELESSDEAEFDIARALIAKGIEVRLHGFRDSLDQLDVPYTGASSEGLMLARDKALTKKLLAYEGIRIPHFIVCHHGAPVQRPSDLRFP